MNKNLLFITILFWAFMAEAQDGNLSNLQTKILTASEGSVRLDSLTVVPESVKVFDLENRIELDTSFFYVKNNTVFFKTVPSPEIQFRITYRTLPYQLDRQFSHLDTSLIKRKSDGTYIGVDFSPFESQEGLLDFKGLDYNGSFARGISFGNNQSLVLNSSFNLQLAGSLGDDIEILAAISDNNIPLQPEGNTQQLQEFDKIFIQLKRKNNALIAGDYELQRPNSYFMNYFKKLQGATYSTESELFSSGILKTKASAAIARGKFTRNNIIAQEGNQGPYRLQGADGERFIIIESGTEKVYIDGQLMNRGLEYDYVIDYNRGDVTFTNKRLITKDSRIVVEFEYSNQNYTRSMTALSTEYEEKKFRLNFNFFNEQDGKTSNGINELTTAQKQFISEQGDQLDNAFFPGIDTLEGGFDPERIMYAQTDTFVNSLLYEDIIVFSTNPEIAIYVARFTEVGQGNGNYIIDEQNPANGRVYKWVAPDSITMLPQGRFEPVIKLVAPQKQQMMTLGGEYQLSKNSSLSAEVALSNIDLNRFSDVDSGDDRGLAFFTHYKNEWHFGKSKTTTPKDTLKAPRDSTKIRKDSVINKRWILQTDLKYEGLQENFSFINPYRFPEFTRDWNLKNNTLDKRTEHIGTGGLILKNDNTQLEYAFTGFVRDSVYTGTKHFARAKINARGFNVMTEGNFLQTESLEERTDFFRPKIDISKTFKKLGNWKLGVYGEREKNRRTDLVTDTLSPTSFYYDLYQIYLESPRKGNFNWGMNYRQRFDYAPVQKDFQQNTTATEFNLNGSWVQKKNSRLGWNLTYRNLEILDTLLTTQKPQETYLGRVDYSVQLFKRLIRSNTTYDIGSGQERKIEFDYQQVDPGQGVYVWNDYNDDGLEQNNEFEVAANPDQAVYIRIPLFSDIFIRTNNVQFNQSLSFNPNYLRTKWFKAKGIKNFLSRFSTISSLRINRKTRDVPEVSQWNPFQLDIDKTALVTLNALINNSLLFNKIDPKFRFQINVSSATNQQVLTGGFENRKTTRQTLSTFWNIFQPMDFEFSIGTGARSSDSEFFNERDYQIEFFQLSPKLTYRFSKNFRSQISYEFSDNANVLLEGNGENAISHDFSMETKYRRTAKTTFVFNLSFVEVAYEGPKNTTIEYTLLDGLQNGKNFLWNLIYERRLSKNIDLRISYEGRKTGTSNPVHVGRAQVRATF